MAGGAAVGAAIGNQADQQQEERIQQRRERIRQRQDVDYQRNQGYDRSSHNADDTYLYNPNTNSGLILPIVEMIDYMIYGFRLYRFI